MKLSAFISGNYSQIGAYKYHFFSPSFINQELEIDNLTLTQQLEKSSRFVGELNAMGKLVPNIDLFISSFVSGEATYSSKIEGTRTSFEDAFKEERDISLEERDDWLEVQLYNKAIKHGLEQLKQLPISSRFMRELHGILLSKGRGREKKPGEFRTSQNWIGGSSIQTAHFIPPHQNLVPGLMTDLEKFLNNDKLKVPDLIRIGIAHYQFETIHPFLDGNGRVGRMIIPLFLVEKKILSKPLLYTSVFFESYRQVYYDKLDAVRQQNNLAGWLLFFLEGIEKTAKFSIYLLQESLKLKENTEETIRSGTGGRASNNLRLLEELFQTPIVNASHVKRKLNLSSPTVAKMLNDLCRLNLLRELTNNRRNRLFLFFPYMNIVGCDFKRYEQDQDE